MLIALYRGVGGCSVNVGTPQAKQHHDLALGITQPTYVALNVMEKPFERLPVAIPARPATAAIRLMCATDGAFVTSSVDSENWVL